MSDFELTLSKTRTGIILHPKAVFISTVLLGLKFKEDPSVDWVSVLHLTVSLNLDWFKTLTKGQRIFAILHEVWHVAYGHTSILPSPNIDHEILNVAEDHVINLKLIEDGFEPIEGIYADPRFSGMTSKEVYDILIDEGFKPPPSNKPMGGEIKQGEGATGPEQKMREVEWAQLIQRASMAQERSGQGSMPDDIARSVKDVLSPKLKWNMILRQHFNKYHREGYNYARRNRRVPNFYLPSQRSLKMGAVRTYSDASYSTSEVELSTGIKELEYMRDLLKPSKIVMHAFACTLGKPQVAEQHSRISFAPDVSGGTSLEPVWEDIKKNKDTQVAIIFTDGEVNVPEEKLKVDLIFIIINRPDWTSTQGRVIHMDIEQ